MARHYLLGLFMLLSCSLLIEALPRPTLQEETTALPLYLTTETEEENKSEKIERSLLYEEGDKKGNTKEIVDKIKALNDAMKKPHKRPQINWNTQPQTGGSYIMDKDVLEKLQQIIASGKLHSSKNNLSLQDDNYVSGIEDLRQSRQAQLSMNQGLPIMPTPYMSNIPVLVMPSTMPSAFSYNSMNTMPFGQPVYSNGFNSMQFGQTRQGLEGGSSPFQFQWPFASWFPILIRDPLLSIMNGGGWSNFFQTGQEADICRRQKSANADDKGIENNLIENEEVLNAVNVINSRQGRAIKKRTVSHHTKLQEVDNTKKTKKIFSTKPLTTRKPVKQAYTEQDTKTVDEGDLRFPFGDFTLFGNRKPVAPSPGFFINRLKVRRGGVAIAGPGGVATAGRGGTAIVGPGGLAYTQPGGLAVAGPAARVVALAPDADLSSIISRLQAQDGSVPRSLQPIIEGKVVATGPVIYYHPTNTSASTQYLPFYGGAKGQYLEVKKDTAGSITSERIVSEDKISNDSIFKNSEDNLLSKVLTANLQSLRTVSNNILKLLTIGRKTGRLGYTEKNRFKTQLAALGEAASNTIKLIEEIGDNVDLLYKKNATGTKKYGGLDEDEDNDDVGEEGVGIDADGSLSSSEYHDEGGSSLVADAKPIALAVVEFGLAAARPIATAVASSGVALSRPIATAIAGVNPAQLGINFNIHHNN